MKQEGRRSTNDSFKKEDRIECLPAESFRYQGVHHSPKRSQDLNKELLDSHVYIDQVFDMTRSALDTRQGLHDRPAERNDRSSTQLIGNSLNVVQCNTVFSETESDKRVPCSSIEVENLSDASSDPALASIPGYESDL